MMYVDLIKPISKNHPCGKPLGYADIVDRILEARVEDDKNLPQGIWQTDIKKADWNTVEHLCLKVFRNMSKDIRILAWLSEAWIAKYQWTGLTDCLRLFYQCINKYWLDIHPKVDNTIDYRISAISVFFNCIDRQLLKIPLVKTVDNDFSYTLSDWRYGEFNQKSSSKSAEGFLLQIKKALSLVNERQRNEQVKIIDEVNTNIAKIDRTLVQKLKFEDISSNQLRANLKYIKEIMIRSFSSIHKEKYDVGKIHLEKDDLGKPSSLINKEMTMNEALQMLHDIEIYIEKESPQSISPALIRLAVELNKYDFKSILNLGKIQNGNSILYHLENLWKCVYNTDHAPLSLSAETSSFKD